MAKAKGFSEYTFSFAVSFEVTSRVYPWSPSLPHFPSLREEFHLGYDFILPLPARSTPLCLQYKLAKPVRNVNFQSKLVKPVYKFDLTQHQNDRLIELASNNFHVYYCAPLFHGERTLAAHFASHRVLDNSLFLPPPTLEDKKAGHKVFFDTAPVAYVCSDPRLLEDAASWSVTRESLHGRQIETYAFLQIAHEAVTRLIKPIGTIWIELDREQERLDRLPPGTYRRDAKSAWRYLWLKLALATYFEVDFQLFV